TPGTRRCPRAPLRATPRRDRSREESARRPSPAAVTARGPASGDSRLAFLVRHPLFRVIEEPAVPAQPVGGVDTGLFLEPRVPQFPLHRLDLVDHTLLRVRQ